MLYHRFHIHYHILNIQQNLDHRQNNHLCIYNHLKSLLYHQNILNNYLQNLSRFNTNIHIKNMLFILYLPTHLYSHMYYHLFYLPNLNIRYNQKHWFNIQNIGFHIIHNQQLYRGTIRLYKDMLYCYHHDWNRNKYHIYQRFLNKYHMENHIINICHLHQDITQQNNYNYYRYLYQVYMLNSYQHQFYKFHINPHTLNIQLRYYHNNLHYIYNYLINF